jgi:hypothetical protein
MAKVGLLWMALLPLIVACSEAKKNKIQQLRDQVMNSGKYVIDLDVKSYE